MKIILSRKGFDSSYGGYPSLILTNGKMVSLPIPSSKDTFSYDELRFDEDNSYMDIMKKVSPKIRDRKQIILDETTMCHLDPDLERTVLHDRMPEWRGCFGQAGSAQAVLEKRGVHEGDLFLFFGWFNKLVEKDGKLSFLKDDGFHAIYGYMQIDKIIYTAGNETIPEWLSYHPHMIEKRRGRTNNCIYIARERASWDDTIPGFGCFSYDELLRLSKPGMSRSKWALPDVFRGLDISYHSEDSWKENYFQSAHRGQEFVIEENEAITRWAVELINSHQG